jgi:hypothetical protein
VRVRVLGMNELRVAMQRARSRKSAGAGGAGDYPPYEERTLYWPWPTTAPDVRPRRWCSRVKVLTWPWVPRCQFVGRGWVGCCCRWCWSWGWSGACVHQSPTVRTQRADVARHKSQGSYWKVPEGPGAYSSSSSPPQPQGESYAAHYQWGYNPDFV